MITGEEKIEFITDSITAYENKIKMKNKLGLFDTATMFENFAVKICRLWFSRDFINLNSFKFNFPYVDLISDNGEIYIQVSTRDDAKTKIESTLKKISESKKQEIMNIKKVIFFMLYNDNIENVVDLVRENQIGNVSFTRKDNLITTQDIIKKAKNEPDFLDELFNVIKEDFDENEKLLLNAKIAVDISKNVGLNKIDSLINNEYFIDRSEFIKDIQLENLNYISIQGEAGSGKSVIAKELVKNEEILLYLRAERFLEEKNVNDIFDFNLVKFYESVKDKLIVIMIDSLEFIADNPSKIDLLEQLYFISEKYKNVKIITTCRSCDKNAFIKIEKKYNIKPYIVPELNDKEIEQICSKYEVIKKMRTNSSYAKLLKVPFYINMIISRINELNSIESETSLRDYIWQNVICLKNRIVAGSKVKHNDVQKTINSIVFKRAKDFILGVYEDDYDSEIIDLLLSEGVIIRNQNTIRLKYDIFEDICFEQMFDKLFVECKGNYSVFFDEIKKFGRCVYRRYQIWISNKLFIKETRNKFLYELIFSDSIPEQWSEQTKIGIIKSRYCFEFFDEYQMELIDTSKINEFIKTINLYGFEFNNEKEYNSLPILQLKSCGAGREKIIEIVFNNNLYKANQIEFNDEIVKLCIDYSKQELVNKSIAEIVCSILQYFIEEQLKNNFDKYNDSYKVVINLLQPLYTLAEYNKNWIALFLEKLYSYYISENDNEFSFAKKILRETFNFKHNNLIKYLHKEVCELAYRAWTYKRPLKSGRLPFEYYKENSIYDKFGLNSFAESYDSESKNIYLNNFFTNLFNYHFWDGLKWSIKFVNELVINYQKNTDDELEEIVITFLKKDTTKIFYGKSDWWLFEVLEHSIPKLIGDLLFILKNRIKYFIKLFPIWKCDEARFLQNFKEYVCNNSNNTLFLYILSQVSIEYKKKYIGLGVELATDINLIYWDLYRQQYLKPNPLKTLLEKSIMYSVGLPSLKGRYELDDTISLRDYFYEIQLYGDSEIRKYCSEILDFLYKQYPDDENNVKENLQIQNMDLRKAVIEPYKDNEFLITQNITGNAKLLVSDSESQIKTINYDNNRIIEKLNNIGKTKKIDIETLDIVNHIIDHYDDIDNSLLNHQNLLMLITFIISDEKIEKEIKNKCCIFWINGIRKIFYNGCFAFEYEWSEILFSCYELDVDDYVKKELKQLMLDCILNSSNNGIIYAILNALKRYLTRNNKLSRVLFNTILKLSEDKMNHQKYNFNKCNGIYKKNKIKFQPHEQPFLSGIDRILKENNIDIYKSNRENIINEYLLNEKVIIFNNFNICNYDINLLCLSFATNVQCSEEDIKGVLKKIISRIIELYHLDRKDYEFRIHKMIDFNSLYILKEYFKEQLFYDEYKEIILGVLFDNTDYGLFTYDCEKFYLEIFDCLLVRYFYSHNNINQRRKCEELLTILESKILQVDNKITKRNLSKILILADTSFMGHNEFEGKESSYTYKDIQFLNQFFDKYGYLNFDDFMITLYRLNYKKTLPYILTSLSKTMKLCEEKYNKEFIDVLNKRKEIMLMVISCAFLDYSDEIKCDKNLTESFEAILELLIKYNVEQAAVILSEFRVH